MKTYLYSIILLSLIVACGDQSKDSSADTTFGGYGDTTFAVETAIPASDLLASLSNESSVEAVVSGEITSACQAKGCWMKMDLGNGEEMHVSFKDYGFFVPKNSASHNATMSGIASIDTISVADLQEWAKDANKTEEEIAAITSPKIKYSFVADGVIIQ